MGDDGLDLRDSRYTLPLDTCISTKQGIVWAIECSSSGNISRQERCLHKSVHVNSVAVFVVLPLPRRTLTSLVMCVLPACRLVSRASSGNPANLRTCTFGVRLLFQAMRDIEKNQELLW